MGTLLIFVTLENIDFKINEPKLNSLSNNYL